jgi:hypothetical protein
MVSDGPGGTRTGSYRGDHLTERAFAKALGEGQWRRVFLRSIAPNLGAAGSTSPNVAVDASPSGQLASRLAGLVVDVRRMTTTVIHFDYEPPGPQLEGERQAARTKNVIIEHAAEGGHPGRDTPRSCCGDFDARGEKRTQDHRGRGKKGIRTAHPRARAGFRSRDFSRADRAQRRGIRRPVLCSDRPRRYPPGRP